MTTLINRLKCATGSTYVPAPAWERDRPGGRLCLSDPEVALGDDQGHAGDLD